MKPQRRHALQTNSLSQWMEDMPEFFKLHGNKILLVVIFIALVILLLRYRANSAEERAQAIQMSLGNARNGISELRHYDPMTPPAKLASERRDLLNSARDSVQTVLDESDDASIKAQALLTKGDLFWTAANLPAIPGAATQPALQVSLGSEDFLKQAEDAYQQVLKEYPNQKRVAAAAQFGIAAIRENQRRFDDAQKIYQSIIDSADVDAMFKDLARTQLSLLEKAKTPVYIGSTEPTTPTPFLKPTTTPSAHPTTTTTRATK
jgi:tetratricopeptide (TPR) repeat protein